MKAKIFYAFCLTVLVGCVPVVNREIVLKEQIDLEALQARPVKLYMMDQSVIIFRNGFTSSGKFIHGEGMKYSFKQDEGTYAVWDVPIESVAALSLESESVNAGRVLGTSMYGLGVLVALGALIFVLGGGGAH